MTKIEKSFEKYLKKQGYITAHTGWPDFIAIKNKQVRFIELKSKFGPKLLKSQKRMHKLLLQSLGVKVEVIKLPHDYSIEIYQKMKAILG